VIVGGFCCPARACRIRGHRDPPFGSVHRGRARSDARGDREEAGL